MDSRISAITPYVVYLNANQEFAYEFLFIHGITGNARETWKSNTYSWAQFISDEFPDSRAHGLEYTSAAFRLSSAFEDKNVGAIAQEAITVIDSLEIGKLPLFVMCHSQGGLLLKAIISHLAVKSVSNNIISPFLQNLCGVTFFGTPHRGAALATPSKWIWPFTSKQARELSPDNPMTEFVHDGFVRFAKERSLQILNLIEQKRTFGIARVVHAPLSEFPDSNKNVQKNHIDICKPLSRNDELCELQKAFILRAIHNKRIRRGIAKNVAIHFLDHHFLQMKGIATETARIAPSDRDNLEIAFKVALLVSDNCIVPGSCLAESEICASLFSRYKDVFPNMFSTENHHNITEYIKESQEKSQGIYEFKPLKLSRFKGISNISLMLRSRTATSDILQGMSNINFDYILRDLHVLVENRALLRLMERRWLDVNSDPVSDFIVPPSLEKYLLDGQKDRHVFERISEIVNELYFKSFLDDFEAVILNPQGSSFHSFKYIEPERVLDMNAILQDVAEPSILPRLSSMTAAQLALFRGNSEASALKAKFWGVAGNRARRAIGWRIV